MQLRYILLAGTFFTSAAFAQDDTAGVIDRSEPEAVIDNTVDRNQVQHMYHINPAVSVPIVAVLGGTTIYAMTIIYNKPKTPESVILNLDKENIPAFDRWNAGWHDADMDRISYYPFYAVMPLPLVLLADKSMKHDRARIGLMYLEAFAVEGIIYTSSVYFADRFRPDVYNKDLDLSYRTNGNFRNSFFAGHVAVVAASTFFISKVYDDYHPHSAFKWVLYGASTAATLGMSYMRLEAGKHFTSDVVVGITVGTACGLLVPVIHKNKSYKDQKWSLYPNIIDKGAGFTFTHRL
jgi:hypothetical protein